MPPGGVHVSFAAVTNDATIISSTPVGVTLDVVCVQGEGHVGAAVAR